MKYLFTLLISFALTSVIAQEKSHTSIAWDFSHGVLSVSDDGHSLVHKDGTTFLWLGDTAWELFHRLTRQEAEFYFEKRRSQGFTVIQAVALAEFGGLTRPTPNGMLPLIDNDPAKPNVKEGPDNDYWDDVDYMFDVAEKKGLYIGFLPTWGDKVLKKWGVGPEIFNPVNAEQYGFFLGKRYGHRPNLIWILGGDRPCERESDIAVWRAMAKGIKDGEKATNNGIHHLMTYHPLGHNTSSTWFHQEDFIDFNMIQSGHGQLDMPNYRMIKHDYDLTPVKPALDGEPRYDNHPVRDKNMPNHWFSDFDIRQAAYWALFSGAFGHTYGCHDIWMMYDGTPERQCADARTPWRESIDRPGAWQMLHLRRLMVDEQLIVNGYMPFQELIAGENPDDAGHIVACQTKDRKRIFIYSPLARPVHVDKRKLEQKVSYSYKLYNPRTGESLSEVRPVSANTDDHTLLFVLPEGQPRENDWVLIINK
jgi:hypothetical protein